MFDVMIQEEELSEILSKKKAVLPGRKLYT